MSLYSYDIDNVSVVYDIDGDIPRKTAKLLGKEGVNITRSSLMFSCKDFHQVEMKERQIKQITGMEIEKDYNSKKYNMFCFGSDSDDDDCE